MTEYLIFEFGAHKNKKKLGKLQEKIWNVNWFAMICCFFPIDYFQSRLNAKILFEKTFFKRTKELFDRFVNNVE